MEARLKALSARGEFWLVSALAFGYYIATSTALLVSRVSRFELTTGRVLRGFVVQVVILAAVYWILRVRGESLANFTRRFTASGALGGIPLFVTWFLVYWTISIVVASMLPAATRMATVQMVPRASPAVFVAFLLLNSFFEEITVVAYVVTRLTPRSAPLAITASAVLRLLYHLYQGPVATIATLPLGLLYAAVFWRWRTVWPLVVAHTITNFVAFAMMRG